MYIYFSAVFLGFITTEFAVRVSAQCGIEKKKKMYSELALIHLLKCRMLKLILEVKKTTVQSTINRSTHFNECLVLPAISLCCSPLSDGLHKDAKFLQALICPHSHAYDADA